MPCIRWLCSFLSLTFATASASGQGLGLLATELHSQATPSTGPITLATAGRIAGSGYADIVQVIGGVPYLLNTPGLFHAFESLPGTWVGVSGLTVRDGGPSPSRQQVLISDASGLKLFVYDASIGKVTMPLPIPGWAGARCLSAADLDGDGSQELIGIDAGGRTLRVLQGAGSGYGLNLAIPLAQPAVAVTTLPWGASQERRVAVAFAGSLVLLDAGLTGTGTVLANSSLDATVGLIPVRTAAGACKLAWCTAGPGGNQLQLVDAASSSSITFGYHELVSATAGDIDADGDDDLLISQRNSHRALLLVHQPYGFSYAPPDVLEIELVGQNPDDPAPLNNSLPLLVDLDNDGDADLVHGVQRENSVAMAFSPFRRPADSSPHLSGGFHSENPQTQQRELRLDIDEWAPPPTATHVELLSWRLVKDSGSVGYRLAIPDEARRQSIEIGAAAMEMTFAPFDQGSVYLIWVRAVTKAGATVVHAFPPSAGIFTGDDAELERMRATFSQNLGEVTFYRPSSGNDIGGEQAGGFIEVLVPPPSVGGSGSVPGG